MQNHEGENIGVLQLINKKKARDMVLDSAESFEQNVLSFDEHDERLVRSLARQAAVSVENNSLYLQRETSSPASSTRPSRPSRVGTPRRRVTRGASPP